MVSLLECPPSVSKKVLKQHNNIRHRKVPSFLELDRCQYFKLLHKMPCEKGIYNDMGLLQDFVAFEQ